MVSCSDSVAAQFMVFAGERSSSSVLVGVRGSRWTGVRLTWRLLPWLVARWALQAAAARLMLYWRLFSKSFTSVLLGWNLLPLTSVAKQNSPVTAETTQVFLCISTFVPRWNVPHQPRVNRSKDNCCKINFVQDREQFQGEPQRIMRFGFLCCCCHCSLGWLFDSPAAGQKCPKRYTISPPEASCLWQTAGLEWWQLF